uniref:Uncharacterized protein n=1 Tax=Chelonoidis abingdonii TaxID=106734 RepID=A0A8C0J6L6_CHEAB
MSCKDDFLSLCYPECGVARPLPVLVPATSPALGSALIPNVVSDLTVVVTLPGPILSNFPQHSAVGAVEEVTWLRWLTVTGILGHGGYCGYPGLYGYGDYADMGIWPWYLGDTVGHAKPSSNIRGRRRTRK